MQYDPKLMRLRQLVVASQYRDQGIGKALVDAVRREHEGRGHTEPHQADRHLLVHAQEERAPFYERAGFRKLKNEAAL